MALTTVGCGMGSEAQPSATALVTSGMPRCDASLLHPRLSVGATGLLPGKLIVYVDGVMACVDDAARVDQLVGQIEGRSPSPATVAPAGATLAAPSDDHLRR